ncbi:MAG: Uma2 family endonuclease [Chloroflexota bacterium]
MATRQTGVRFRSDDVFAAPEDEYRYEVIDGELYMSPAPGWGHQVCLSNLNLILGPTIKSRRLGKIVQAPTTVVLDDENAVQPDLLFISTARQHLISARGVEGPPDLVVEALSPRTRDNDLGLKMRRYARARIPHYWVLDYERREFLPYRLVGSAYVLIEGFPRGGTFQPDLFPGLEIPLDELWD